MTQILMVTETSSALGAVVAYAAVSIDRARRNHALEHATLHVLRRTNPQAFLVGRSDAKGFILYGEIGTEAVGRATFEALKRLKRGEFALAIHPNCGTNLLTSGVLAALAALLVSGKARGLRQWLARLPLAIAASVLALIAAKPLGQLAQKHLTTNSDLATLEIRSVERLSLPRPITHRIRTIG